MKKNINKLNKIMKYKQNIKILLRNKQIQVYVHNKLFFQQDIIAVTKYYISDVYYWYLFVLFVLYQHGLFEISENTKFMIKK